MTSESLSEIQRIAERQARHLDSITTHTLTVTVLLGAAGGAYAVELDDLGSSATWWYAIIGLLMLAAILCILVLSSRVLLLPNPAKDRRVYSQSLNRTVDLERFCLDEIIATNHARNKKLMLAWMALFVAIALAILWSFHYAAIRDAAPDGVSLSIEEENDAGSEEISAETVAVIDRIVEQAELISNYADNITREAAGLSTTAGSVVSSPPNAWIRETIIVAVLLLVIPVAVWRLTTGRNNEIQPLIDEHSLIDVESKGRHR